MQVKFACGTSAESHDALNQKKWLVFCLCQTRGFCCNTSVPEEGKKVKEWIKRKTKLRQNCWRVAEQCWREDRAFSVEYDLLLCSFEPFLRHTFQKQSWHYLHSSYGSRSLSSCSLISFLFTLLHFLLDATCSRDNLVIMTCSYLKTLLTTMRPLSYTFLFLLVAVVRWEIPFFFVLLHLEGVHMPYLLRQLFLKMWRQHKGGGFSLVKLAGTSCVSVSFNWVWELKEQRSGVVVIFQKFSCQLRVCSKNVAQPLSNWATLCIFFFCKIHVSCVCPSQTLFISGLLKKKKVKDKIRQFP